MFKTLKFRLLAVSVSITLLSMCLLAVTLGLIARTNTLDAIDERVGQMTQAYAGQISTWAKDRQRITGSLKAVVDSPDPVPFLHTTKAAGGFDNAFFVKADKTAVFPKPRPTDYDGTARPWYKQAVSARGPAITPAYADTTTKLLTISFVEPVIGPDGQVQAVVGSDVHLTSITKLVETVRPTAKSGAYLIDHEGKVLAGGPPELALQPIAKVSADLTGTLLQSVQDTYHAAVVDIGGAQHLLYAARVADTPWTLLVAVDRADAMAPIWGTVKAAALVALLCMVAAGLLLSFFTSRQLRRLGEVRNALHDIASGEGDLSQRLSSSGHDELAQIALAFNRFVDKIEAVLLRIRESSESVRTTTDEISSGNLNLSERTEHQASSLQTTAAAMEQLTSTVHQNAESAREARELATAASDVAQRGGEVAQRAVQTMHEINGSSQRISEILGVIDGIAFQTNILALNAAVEAARAGDQGRGFAVVAGEVRTLAQRSATAAKEIKVLINASQQHVDAGSRFVNEAGTTIQETVRRVHQVSALITEISHASQEQSSGIASISEAVAQMDVGTQQNAALVEQATAAAQSLNEQAHRLADTIADFKLSQQASPGLPTGQARLAMSAR